MDVCTECGANIKVSKGFHLPGCSYHDADLFDALQKQYDTPEGDRIAFMIDAAGERGALMADVFLHSQDIGKESLDPDDAIEVATRAGAYAAILMLLEQGLIDVVAFADYLTL